MKTAAGLAILLVLAGCRASQPGARRLLIVSPRDAGRTERYAAHEVRRYLYLRTGQAVPIADERTLGQGTADLVVVARRESPAVAAALGPEDRRAVAGLPPQAYFLRTIDPGPGRPRTLVITGGDEAGLLYGVYGFLEHLGVRFSLHGDTIPDERIPPALPSLNETRSPLFALRGILPFHDFPEGPDWWTEDDYFAVLAQVAKLKMNFIGLHNYTWPNYAPRAEPTVWIGTPGDVGADGTVRSSYPASYQNNLLDSWGYKPVPAGRFHYGTADLFEHDDTYGEIMHGLCPEPATPEAANELFNRTGALLRNAFGLAHRLSIRTCVGTEVPLVVPRTFREKPAGAGAAPAASDRRDLYAGIFDRISRTYPIDFYWLWTPEPWTWKGASEAAVKETVDDLLAAVEVHRRSGARFRLATCGWVLGPPQDRTLFDRHLPREMPFSCINREVGYLPVDAGFGRIAGRPKWAIPWLEDDGAMTVPQLWVGRMRRDAVDARKYGCEGLLGIHWRTRVIDPNVSALAAAAWDQEDWPLAGPEPAPPVGPPAPADRPGYRHLASADFYERWCAAEFGPAVGPELAAIFAGVDGRLPPTTEWPDGPGGLVPDPASWETSAKPYAFVAGLEAARPRVRGAGNLERFDYWLASFRYMRAVGRLKCLLGEYDRILREAAAAGDPGRTRAILEERALPKRVEMVAGLAEVYRWLVATICSPGELGTLANWERHILPAVFTKPGEELETKLGRKLPAEAQPATAYTGEARVILPTRPSFYLDGRPLSIKVMVLSQRPVRRASLFYRALGAGRFVETPLSRAGRGVFAAALDPGALRGSDIEYYVEVVDEGGALVRSPASAPALNLTAVPLE